MRSWPCDAVSPPISGASSSVTIGLAASVTYAHSRWTCDSGSTPAAPSAVTACAAAAMDAAAIDAGVSRASGMRASGRRGPGN